MLNKNLLEKINKVEALATASKWARFAHNPFKYFSSIFFKEVIYKSRKKEKLVQCETFFEKEMYVYLPSSTDIYLTKGKSHNSEIRLCRFLIKNLSLGEQFLDIGAHYGYFSLLAANLVGPKGRVVSYEASPKTFEILKRNSESNIAIYNKAISDTNEPIRFFEFPNLYSEFNTTHIDQFKNEAWFLKHTPSEITVPAQTLDSVLFESAFDPDIIKIDVEGAEFNVLNGGRKYLAEKGPVVVMEFLSKERDNEEHVKAEQLMRNLGFQVYCILENGDLMEIKDGSHYLSENKMDSDNLVFL